MRTIALVVLLARAAFADTAGMIDRLDWADEPNRLVAYEGLRKVGPSAFPAVLEAFPKLRLPSRRLAARLLEEYAQKMDSIEKQGSRVIQVARKCKDPTVRRRVASTLLKCGPKNLPALIRLAVEDDRILADAATAAIARIGEPGWPRIQRILDSRSAAYRCAGLEIVAQLQGDVARFEPRVRALCTDKDDAVRGAAMLAITRVSRNASMARARLLRGLDDRNRFVALKAGRGLARLGDAESVAAVLARIEKSGGVDCTLEIEVLRMFGADRRAEIEKGLDSGTEGVRLAVAQAISTKRTRRCLVALVASKQEAIRKTVVSLLGASPEEVQGLVTLANDPSAAVRDAAIWVLAHRSPQPKLLPLFVHAIEDGSADVRAGAWLGLWNAEAKELPPVAMLLALFRDDGCARAPSVLAQVWPGAPDLLADLDAAAGSSNERRAVAAVHALGEVLPLVSKGTPRARAARFAEEPAPVREACARAWKWLEARQKSMPGGVGRAWSSAGNGGHPQCDLGVSALAVLAFTAAGWNAASPQHGAALRDAGRYLRSRQDADGHLGPKTHAQSRVQHAIAANALCELALLQPSRPSELRIARQALKFIRGARNKHLAWRYRGHPGENDTFVTTWMVLALKTGEHVGLGADRDAYEGARQWYDKMTDPEFGYTGYNVAGGSPARIVDPATLRTGVRRIPLMVPIMPFGRNRNSRAWKDYERRKAAYDKAVRAAGPSLGAELSRSNTAMAMWARVVLGLAVPAEDKLFKRGSKLITELPPVWDEEKWSIDLCSWMFGSRALALHPSVDTEPPVRWRRALADALLAHQLADGSWPATGVWGKQGGKVYATSMAVMALLGRVPYGRGLADPAEPEAVRSAIANLKALKRSGRKPLARAAERALARLGR